MSGRTKRTLYYIASSLLFLCAMAGSVLMAYLYGFKQKETFAYHFSFWVFCAITAFLPLEILVHELGHLLLGLILGFRPISFSVYGIILGRGSSGSRYACRAGGQTVLLPRNDRSVRGRYIFSAFGGAAFNLIYGGILLTCFFIFPLSPALFFFALFAPLNLYQGIAELIPCELPEGRTDGKMILELCKNTSYAQTFLAVLIAQGRLISQSYSELPKDLLFRLPVVREDDPAAMAVLQMRWQYAHFNGDDEEAQKQISRMESICDDGVAPIEFLCDVIWWKRIMLNEEVAEQTFKGKTIPELRTRYALEGKGKNDALDAIKREKMVGIRLFEEKLIAETQEKLQ